MCEHLINEIFSKEVNCKDLSFHEIKTRIARPVVDLQNIHIRILPKIGASAVLHTNAHDTGVWCVVVVVRLM